MPIVRILVDYTNTSGWKKGDLVDITNPWTLIKEGNVVLVDDQGNEIAPPAEISKCPICIFKTYDPFALADHILTHKKKASPLIQTEEVKEEVPVKEEVEEIPKEETSKEEAPQPEVTEVKEENPKMTPEELKTMRLENLKRAREAKVKKEEELAAEVAKEVIAND